MMSLVETSETDHSTSMRHRLSRKKWCQFIMIISDDLLLPPQSNQPIQVLCTIARALPKLSLWPAHYIIVGCYIILTANES